VARRLRVAGADARIGRRASTSVPTVLVGPWAALRRDPGARQVESGPRQSGVFADVAGGRLLALDQSGAVARRLSAGAGLLAAVRDGDAQPSWLVTGSTEAGVDAAAGLLDERVLGDKYAVEVDGGPVIRLPVR
jgi:hypothetical protein